LNRSEHKGAAGQSAQAAGNNLVLPSS